MYILIITWYAVGVGAKYPQISTQEFTSKETCDIAAKHIQQMFDHRSLALLCTKK